MIRKKTKILPSSFRDPSGFLFSDKGHLYRQVNLVYKKNYERLIQSGLYKKLTKENLLIPHKESLHEPHIPESAYKVIKPKKITFISYPYEWSFSQLRDAALTILKIQDLSLEHGMTLKDSSAYNIQFLEGKPVLIDTLSLEVYKKESPWIAYRQFCQHFLAPLALMSYIDVRLSLLLKNHIDGIPLDFASKLLPISSRLNLSLLSHIYLHAESQCRFAKSRPKLKGHFSLQQMKGLIDNLKSGVKSLGWKQPRTEWSEYYQRTNYSREAFEHKKKLVKSFLGKTNPKIVWDLGANVGTFSRLASDQGIFTVAFDVDPVAVESNYLKVKERGEETILPVVMDLTNPSPALGWAQEERDSLTARGPADTLLALALIHHLCISNNLPFENISSFLVKNCRYLIIEFVPKEDSQVKRLLSMRKDIFGNYNQKQFEKVFSDSFQILKREPIKESKRILYLMKKR